MRNNRMQITYVNHEVITEVIVRQCLPGEIELDDYEEKRENIFCRSMARKLFLRNAMSKNVLHHLFDDRNDLIWKMD